MAIGAAVDDESTLSSNVDTMTYISGDGLVGGVGNWIFIK